jgi:hypothetical protein
MASSTGGPGSAGNELTFAMHMKHRDAMYKASSLDPALYPGGESDVIKANMFNDLTVEELVSIVHSTGDTVFPFDARTTTRFFEVGFIIGVTLDMQKV